MDHVEVLFEVGEFVFKEFVFLRHVPELAFHLVVVVDQFVLLTENHLDLRGHLAVAYLYGLESPRHLMAFVLFDHFAHFHSHRLHLVLHLLRRPFANVVVRLVVVCARREHAESRPLDIDSPSCAQSKSRVGVEKS